MKHISPQQELESHRNGITDSIRRWKHLNLHGGSDPQWCDGANMNLIRNHIIYHKHRIAEICAAENWGFPSEYYLPFPPIVPDDYMANTEQYDRIEKLRTYGHTPIFKKPVYDEMQLSLF